MLAPEVTLMSASGAWSIVRAVRASVATGLLLSACTSTPSGPTGPEPGPPPMTAGPPAPEPPLFAFKAGLDQTEQIWLWMDGGRLHPVSTWSVDDPVTTISRAPSGYVEGLGRFGPLRFDHQHRFLLTSERITDPTRRPRPPSRRFVSYEVATGNLVLSGPLTDWVPEILSTASTTLVVAPAANRTPGKPWLYSVVEGKLVPAPGAAEIVAPDSQASSAADVDGDPVLAVGKLVVRRQQGRWRTIDGLDTTWFWQVSGAPTNDAACVIGRQLGSPAPTVSYLLTTAEGLRPLACDGLPTSCTFSPDGKLLYLEGCSLPVIGRDLQARVATPVRLRSGANIKVNDVTLTLGSVAVDTETGGHRPVLTAFDWQTLRGTPLPAGDQMLPENCSILSIDTPGVGTGIAVLRTDCGCADCRDGSAFALDIAAQRLHLIHERGRALVYGTALLGPAVITTMTGATVGGTGDEGAPLFYWSDASGTRLVGPIPEVRGLLHDPIRF
jgi:hypothetical protein